MTATLQRIKLTGRTDALGGLRGGAGRPPALTAGSAARIETAAFEEDGLMLLSMAGVTSITLEIRRTADAPSLLMPAVTVTGDDINESLTLTQWRAGTACHAAFALSDEDTDVIFTGAQTTCWGSIYAILENGDRVTLGAGNVLLKAGASGTPGPPPETATQWLSKPQAEALVGETLEVLSTPVPGTDRQVFLAARTDGRSGRGTALDPFDISTPAKADAVFAALGTAPANITLEAGEYSLNHIHPSWAVREGWHIAGRGMDRTIISIVNPVAETHISLLHAGGILNHASVRDLAIDGGLTTAAATQKLGAIYLSGNYLTVERVLVRRCGGGWGEQFPIFLYHDLAGDPRSLLIADRCIVKETRFGVGGCSGIILAGGVGGNVHPVSALQQSGKIINCVLDASGCLGVANFYNWQLTGNTVDAAGAPAGTAAVNMDTGHCRRGVIRDNHFRNTFFEYGDFGPVNIGGAAGVDGEPAFDDILITGNYIHTVFGGHGLGILRVQGETRGIRLVDNTGDCAASALPAYFGIISTGPNNAPIYKRGNRMRDGTVIAALADS